MACSFEFPATFPGDCATTLADIVLSGEIGSRRGEAVRSGAAVLNYVVGQFADEEPTGTLSVTEAMGDTEAAAMLQQMASDAPAHAFDKAKLKALAKWLITTVLPLLLG
jgi:hypothetical protein